MAYPTDEQIRIRAYKLWEQAGKPEAREEEFWHLAERELQEPADNSEPAVLPNSEPTLLPGLVL